MGGKERDYKTLEVFCITTLLLRSPSLLQSLRPRPHSAVCTPHVFIPIPKITVSFHPLLSNPHCLAAAEEEEETPIDLMTVTTAKKAI